MKSRKTKLISLILIMIASVFVSYLEEAGFSFGLEEESVPSFNESADNLVIRYIDVGQADATLIQSNGEYMLIDCGNNEDGNLLVKYFEEMGITKLKYLIGTHPHEDHIGGMDNIIRRFDIGTIYMPDVITTTKTFNDVLDAISYKRLSYKVPIINEDFKLGNATVRFIYTGTDNNDLNDASIILKLTYGNNSFLFAGDATKKIEKQILNNNIKADVLKVSHHGSSYSNSNDFLDKVNPKYGIISVGEDNSYNHPHNEVINNLNKRNISIYRTDMDGTIILTSDGENITIDSAKTNTNGG